MMEDVIDVQEKGKQSVLFFSRRVEIKRDAPEHVLMKWRESEKKERWIKWWDHIHMWFIICWCLSILRTIQYKKKHIELIRRDENALIPAKRQPKHHLFIILNYCEPPCSHMMYARAVRTYMRRNIWPTKQYYRSSHSVAALFDCISAFWYTKFPLLLYFFQFFFHSTFLHILCAHTYTMHNAQRCKQSAPASQAVPQ